MSTDQTPALDRAAEALCTADSSYWHHEQTDDYPCSSCVEKAQTAMSAALHDPDDVIVSALRLEFAYQMRTSATHGRFGQKVTDEDIINAAALALAKVRAAILGADQ